MSRLTDASERVGRWVGIDEAGYGPNLGPLVMTAVIAEGPIAFPPDLWIDLSRKVARAGSSDDRLWVDDSKKVFSRGNGRDRLEAATLAALSTTGVNPRSFHDLLQAVGVDERATKALLHWAEAKSYALPTSGSVERVSDALRSNPFDGAGWRISSIRTVVLDAEIFNERLEVLQSKALVHFEAFVTLLRPLIDQPATTFVRGDKHGGRHYYYAPLTDAFPDRWIDRIEESPSCSRYSIRGENAPLTLELIPRADASDGLVALASIVSKCIRELWMDVFNGYWLRRVPGLRPTAGYPQDARRFRSAIESVAEVQVEPTRSWWRAK